MNAFFRVGLLAAVTWSRLAVATEPPPPAAVALPAGEAEAVKAKPVTKVFFKPGSHFRVATDDGRYSLALGARLQFWYALTATPGEDGERDLAHGFQLRRARVILFGSLIDGKFKYGFELGFAPRNLGLVGTTVARTPLFDGWLGSEHLRDLSVRAGQFKVPYSHEFLISAGNLQAVDLSGPTNEFALDRDLGAMLFSSDAGGLDRIRWYAGVFGGEGHSTWQPTKMGALAVGRVEVFPMGTWDDYGAQSDHARERKAHLALGAAFAYQHGAHHERGTTGVLYADGGTAELQHATADLVFDVAGFSLEGAFFWRHGTRTPGSALDATGTPIPAVNVRNGLGLQAQAGYLIPRTGFEVAGQFTQVRPLGDDSAIRDVTNDVTAAASWYFLRHAYKLQADYSRIWTEKAGLQAGTDQLRVQVQVTL